MIQQQRLIDTLMKLVHVNSPSLLEAEVMDVAQAHLERLGFSVERDDAGEKLGGNTGNIIARRAGTTGATPIFLNAHIDTVQPTPGITVIQENGVIKTDGRTILGADDKAGVACIFEALESLNDDGVAQGDIEVIVTIAEEIGLKGAREFDASRIKARSGWVLDSGKPLNSIVMDAPSQDKMRAVVHGRAAHAGAAPENGISAITVACKAIAVMPLGRLDHETTANVGTIVGGQATNIVAPEVEIWGEARSRDVGKLERQTQAMKDALNNAAREMGATVDITVERAFTSFTVEANAREIRIAAEAMRSLGLEPTLNASGGGMDANYFNQKGMKCVVLPCGYQDIHTPAENIAVDDMVTGARILEAVLKIAATDKG